ncbi:MAG: hypothetical protein ACT4TC_02500, partial [Myxococcaceae bacterium]
MGATCATGADCGSGECQGGACIQGKRPLGTACVIGAQCASGTCTEKTCRPDELASSLTAEGTCKKIDLIFTVDNSQSMQEEHKAMRTTVFPAFAKALKGIKGLEDFRVGVDDACPFPATFKTRGTTAPECAFQSGKPWMTNASTKLEEEFACAGDIWSGDAKCTGANDDEQPASAAAATLEGANPGFLRDDAVLVAVGITDEDEKYTPGPGPFDVSRDLTAQQIYDRLVATKGGNVNRMVFLGIGGKEACTHGTYGSALEAKKLKAVTELFKKKGRGVFWDL